jgi:hypothetical protein
MPLINTNPQFATIVLGLGAELLVLGIATGVASMNDEVGTLMLVLMSGFLLLFVMTHTQLIAAIPNVFPTTSTATNKLGG